jgi:preprotein translocase subunit YajC
MSLFGLIPDAYAQTAAPAGAAGPMDLLQQVAPFVLIIGIFYFLLIRPQQQKQKQLRNQLAELKRGDSVITSGGIIGTVARVISDDELSIEIAEGVRVRVIRSTITGITAKGEPRPDSKDGDAEPVALKPAARRGRPGPANESKPQA